ncbi:MAG: hypothetical protein V1776_02070 [Candidatus Diapherotrites archaeon]
MNFVEFQYIGYQNQPIPANLHGKMGEEMRKRGESEMISAVPSNKRHFRKLMEFFHDILRICRKAKANPVVYGSMAYFWHTLDTHAKINDVDLLVSEQAFPLIIEGLKKAKIQHRFYQKWRTIHVEKDGLKIELDSKEFWFHEKNEKCVRFNFGGLKIKSLNRNDLSRTYATAIRKKKNKDYEKKYEKLTDLAAKQI